MRPIQKERHEANESGGALGRELVQCNTNFAVVQPFADLLKWEILHKLRLCGGGGVHWRGELAMWADVVGRQEAEARCERCPVCMHHNCTWCPVV
eukprot:scaffold22309_cov116-Isochrysis_galbana.AAC.5